MKQNQFCLLCAYAWYVSNPHLSPIRSKCGLHVVVVLCSCVILFFISGASSIWWITAMRGVAFNNLHNYIPSTIIYIVLWVVGCRYWTDGNTHYGVWYGGHDILSDDFEYSISIAFLVRLDTVWGDAHGRIVKCTLLSDFDIICAMWWLMIRLKYIDNDKGHCWCENRVCSEFFSNEAHNNCS